MIKSSYCYPGCNVVPILKELTKHIPDPCHNTFYIKPSGTGVKPFNVAPLKDHF